ncbi:hypothetical protein QFC21_000898 [Naganishia friedmannii]|uniref:Uncharacterized protein n=1 Tax=Naganishia friedmannii TaxID=89922 RepID=A0ACC2W8N0_9TREE|nr:hypothetical protein QFC21_000898 [Naganishia friedmannii]
MAAPPCKNVHLVVLIHGLWGNSKHLEVAREELQFAYERAKEQEAGNEEACLPELRILVAQGNEGTYTYDGIDVCAGRVAREIEKEVARIEKDGSIVARDFSVMGYSVGGREYGSVLPPSIALLMIACAPVTARYLIGLLHSRDPSFLVKHRPVNFTTLATPHVGIVKYRGRFWQWVAVKWAYSLLGRTGDQLYTWDKYSTQDERSLLEVMSDSDEVFIKALNSFQRIDFFANAVQDHTVPYPTGAINYDDPFVQIPAKSSVNEEIVVETDEAGIIQRWFTVPVEDAVREGKARPKGPVRAPTSPHSTYSYQRSEATISASTGRAEQKRLGRMAKRKRPPIFPPFLVFPRPFNWILYASTPVFMPIFMVGVVIAFVIDSGRSRRRARSLAGEQPLTETVATVVSLASRKGSDPSAPSSSRTSSPDRLLDQRLSMQSPGGMETVHKRPDAVARTMSNNMVRRTTGCDSAMYIDESDDEIQITLDLDTRIRSASNGTDQSRRFRSEQLSETESSTSSTLVNESSVGKNDGVGSILNNIKHWSKGKITHPRSSSSRPFLQRNATLRPTTSKMHSMVADRTEYKASYEDEPYPHPAHDSSASPHRPESTEKKDVKLELTDVQRRIIRNLNEGIEPSRFKKWLTWFPMVRNAHAAISVRYVQP